MWAAIKRFQRELRLLEDLHPPQRHSAGLLSRFPVDEEVSGAGIEERVAGYVWEAAQSRRESRAGKGVWRPSAHGIRHCELTIRQRGPTALCRRVTADGGTQNGDDIGGRAILRVNRDGVLQHFDGDQFTGLAVGGTEHVGKAAATDPIRLQQESPAQRAGLLVRLRPTGLGLTKARAVSIRR